MATDLRVFRERAAHATAKTDRGVFPQCYHCSEDPFRYKT
jgi:hypothetical protein